MVLAIEYLDGGQIVGEFPDVPPESDIAFLDALVARAVAGRPLQAVHAVEFSFDPNQPRDDKGRWRWAGGEAPVAEVGQAVSRGIRVGWMDVGEAMYGDDGQSVLDHVDLEDVGIHWSSEGVDAENFALGLQPLGHYDARREAEKYPDMGVVGVVVYGTVAEVGDGPLPTVVLATAEATEHQVVVPGGSVVAADRVEVVLWDPLSDEVMIIGERELDRDLTISDRAGKQRAVFVVRGVTFRFDPQQPRDDKGRWRETGAEARSQGALQVPQSAEELEARATARQQAEADTVGVQTTKVKTADGSEYEVTTTQFGIAGRQERRDVRAMHVARTADGQEAIVYDTSLLDRGVGGVAERAKIAAYLAKTYDTMGHPSGKPPVIELMDSQVMERVARLPGKEVAAVVQEETATTINMNAKIAGWDKSKGVGKVFAAQHMDAQDDVSLQEYIVAHEYGHSDDFWRRTKGTNPGNHNYKAFTLYPKLKDSMSMYAQGHVVEGYAEAFAEWALTGGQTDNTAAYTYAGAFKWEGVE